MVAGLSSSKPVKEYPKEGIVYSFTGCTINYDADIVWCLASSQESLQKEFEIS
jgi:hypothetical protein